MNEEEFEELFGNTPFENIKKIQHYIEKLQKENEKALAEYMKWQKQELEKKIK